MQAYDFREVRPPKSHVKYSLTLHSILNKIVDHYKAGHLSPITPVKVFPAAEVEECFRYMQKGTHLGKIVVNMEQQNATAALPVTSLAMTMQLQPDASYLLIGGLGGLGRSISTWMIEHGARHLVYLSRSAGNGPQDQQFFAELKDQGCIVTAIQGDVAISEDVARAVRAAPNLRGILQMSMVLRDCQLANMTYKDWNTAITPKVQGTWNLHELTLNRSLDFFVLFSSISGALGQQGQSNYAAANTFLDAFVQYRLNLGLPAYAIDIGLMEDAGYVAQNPAILHNLKAMGISTLREPQLLNALTLAMTPRPAHTSKDEHFTNTNQLLLGLWSNKSPSDPTNRLYSRRDRRVAIGHNRYSKQESAKSTSTNHELKQFLATSAADPEVLRDKNSSAFLARQIALKIFDLVLKPVEESEDIDVSLSVQDLGLDSLVAIELRAWWKQTFGFEISVLEMLGMGSVLAMGEAAVQGLLDKHQVGDEKRQDAFLESKMP
jgi:acyl carrier protein